MGDTYEYITKTAEETAAYGKKIAQSIRAGDILCLYGELGSGKTTFVQGLARGMGITTRLLSPTFIIVRRYDIPSTEKFLYHMDLYRLKNSDDLSEIGLHEIFADPNAYVVIEWAEKLGSLLPSRRTDIQFEVRRDGSHKILVKKVIP